MRNPALSLMAAAAMLLGIPAVAAAAGAAERTVIVVLGWFPREDYANHLNGIAEGLARYGFTRGDQYEFDFHHLTAKSDVKSILAGRPPGSFVIYSASTSPAKLVQTSGISAPHVFLTYSDPLANGLIGSYAKPGGHATGVVEYAPIHDKRLDLLRQLMPRANKVAILVGADGTPLESQEAADTLMKRYPGYSVKTFRILPTESAEDISERLRRAGIQAAYVPLSELEPVVDVTYAALRKLRLPVISEGRSHVEKGAILALEVDRRPMVPQVSHQLALVLRGVPPGSIPVHSPRSFLLTANLDVARRIGVEIPRSLLRQAEFIISDGR